MFVKLPESRITLNTDNILFIAQQEINKFVIFFKAAANGPVISGTDKDLLENVLPGGVLVLETPPKVVVS